MLTVVAAAVAALSALIAAPVPHETAVVQEATAVVRPAPTQAPSAPETSLEAALAASQWPPELWARVEAVVYCESRAEVTAVSPDGYVGLLQIDPSLHGPVPADAVGQLNLGWEVYKAQGWGAWPVCGR